MDKSFICYIGLHSFFKKEGTFSTGKKVNLGYVCTKCHYFKAAKSTRTIEKVERKKYWCRTSKRWLTEYAFLWWFKIYKSELFGTKPRWTFKGSDNPQHEAYCPKIKVTEAQLFKLWGNKKYFWNYDWKEKFTIIK